MVAAGECPHRVVLPAMEQDWVGLSFLHWRYRPDHVQRLLPRGLSVDVCDGGAWVSLAPFLLRVRPPHGPALPWLCQFPETNVRTYVLGPDGERGIWFLSLDAPRRLAIWAARQSYHLPYRHATMRLRCGDEVRTYSSVRDDGTACAATIEVGEPIPAAELSRLDHFLTARWRLYAGAGTQLRTACVEHAPWRLRRAVACNLNASLLPAAGLPAPQGPPLVHACEDVHASLTRLRRCA